MGHTVHIWNVILTFYPLTRRYRSHKMDVYNIFERQVRLVISLVLIPRLKLKKKQRNIKALLRKKVLSDVGLVLFDHWITTNTHFKNFHVSILWCACWSIYMPTCLFEYLYTSALSYVQLINRYVFQPLSKGEADELWVKMVELNHLMQSHLELEFVIQ